MNCTQDNTLLQELVQDTIRRWRSGERPDADALLKCHPALAENKGLAIDLIYEEYCLRHEQGDTLVPSTFCERFPHYEQSLTKMLAVHETMEESTLRPAAPVKSPWPSVGDSFLGYELVEALGRGSLARVFLAREEAVGKRLVVVKISRHGAGEAQMLGKAAHPGIVPILSVTHDDSTGWTVICMPYLGTATGSDLLKAAFAGGRASATAEVIAEVAAQNRPAGVTPDRSAPQVPVAWHGSYPDGIARLGLLLAEGLEAAHGVGVMHRDIKPSNVLLAWSGRPMLLDFNLSTEIGWHNQRVAGTLAYMAPEQMEAMTTNQGRTELPFDPRSDIFSLGALLYELLTGRLPAKPPNAEQLAPGDAAPWLAARRQSVAAPRQIDPRIDPGLEAIVLRCLINDQHGRFASAGELAGALRNYLGWGPRRLRQLRHRRREVLLAALGATAVAVGGAIFVSRLPPLEERLYAQGLRAYEAEDYAAAEQSFGQCQKLRPDWPAAMFGRGQALRMQGDYVGARTEFLNLGKYSVALAHSFAGYCNLMADNATGADIDYSIATQKGRPTDAVTWNNFGYCQMNKGLFAESTAAFDKAVAIDPTLAVAHCNGALARFQVSMRAGQPVSQETIRAILEACRLQPERGDFHFHAASIFVVAMQAKTNGSHAEQAREHLQRAYELKYPRDSQSGFPLELLKQLPEELRVPEPNLPPPPPLFASPSADPEIGILPAN